MEFTYKLIELEDGYYGYLIESTDGTYRLFNDFAPGVQGEVRMSESEASGYAESVISMLTA